MIKFCINIETGNRKEIPFKSNRFNAEECHSPLINVYHWKFLPDRIYFSMNTQEEFLKNESHSNALRALLWSNVNFFVMLNSLTSLTWQGYSLLLLYFTEVRKKILFDSKFLTGLPTSVKLNQNFFCIVLVSYLIAKQWATFSTFFHISYSLAGHCDSLAFFLSHLAHDCRNIHVYRL